MKRRFQYKKRRTRGATLLFVLLILALAMMLASRRFLANTNARLAAAGTSFRTESSWIAEGVAQQWATASQSPTATIDSLLQPSKWSMGLYEVEVMPSSSQDKLQASLVPGANWLPYYRQHCEVQLVEDPDKALTQRGGGALEMLLDSRYLSGQDAYWNESGRSVPADYLTVWGSGKVDLNHCPPQIMALRLHGFTDAQISGIVRLRSEKPILRIAHVAEDLNLDEYQKKELEQAATLGPETFELIIRVRKNTLAAVFHAVVEIKGNPQLRELRSIE